MEVGYGVPMVGLWFFYGVICGRWFVGCFWEQRWRERKREGPNNEEREMI